VLARLQTPASYLSTQLGEICGGSVAALARAPVINPSIVAALKALLQKHLPYLVEVIESIPGLRQRLLARWLSPLRETLTGLAAVTMLQLQLSHRCYQQLRARYAAVSRALQCAWFPPLADIRQLRAECILKDRSGIYKIEAVGKTGRLLDPRAALTAQLSHPGIRPAIDLRSFRRPNVLYIVLSVDACKIGKRRVQTVAGHRILNIHGAHRSSAHSHAWVSHVLVLFLVQGWRKT